MALAKIGAAERAAQRERITHGEMCSDPLARLAAGNMADIKFEVLFAGDVRHRIVPRRRASGAELRILPGGKDERLARDPNAHQIDIMGGAIERDDLGFETADGVFDNLRLSEPRDLDVGQRLRATGQDEPLCLFLGGQCESRMRQQIDLA